MGGHDNRERMVIECKPERSESELITLPQVVNLSGTLKNYEIFDLHAFLYES